MSLRENVSRVLNAAVARGDVAGALFGVVDRTGKVLLAENAGLRAVGSEEKLELDAVFPIFSLTKLITTIAALQLVERGKLALDDPLEPIVPEFTTLKVLQDDGTVQPVKDSTKITLRMLLSHTAGFAYTFNDRLAAYLGVKPFSVPGWSGKRADLSGNPLVFEPGTSWEYGVSIDWVGEVVARVSGLSLGQYCEDNIFKPLGITDMSFRTLSPAQRAKLAGIHSRQPDGSLAPRDFTRFPLGRVVLEGEFDCGGAGAFGTLHSYLRILAVLLNSGVGPNGTRVLEARTVKAMFEDQADVVPEWRDAIRTQGTDVNALYTGVPAGRGWGLSFQLNLKPLSTGRAAGSATWVGAANLYYSVDPAQGVAMTLFTSSVPVFDPVVMRVFAQCETAAYDSLREARL